MSLESNRAYSKGNKQQRGFGRDVRAARAL